MDRKSRGWGSNPPFKPFNFNVPTEFVLISFVKSEVRKTLNINSSFIIRRQLKAKKDSGVVED